MKRWLVMWGPPMLGLALSTGGAMAAVQLGTTGHYVLAIPGVATCIVAFLGAMSDMTSDGEVKRGRALDARPCDGCAHRDRLLAAATQDASECREALAALKLPEGT